MGYYHLIGKMVDEAEENECNSFVKLNLIAVASNLIVM